MADEFTTVLIPDLDEAADLQVGDLLVISRGGGPAQTAPVEAMMAFLEDNGVGAAAAAAAAASAATAVGARDVTVTARDEAEEARDAAVAAAVETVNAIELVVDPDIPLTPDGTKVLEYAEDADGVKRIVRGINIWTGEPVFPGLVTAAALDALDEVVGPMRGALPLALNGEVALAIFGTDRRAITINPLTGLITPSQAGGASAFDSLFPSDPRLLVSDYYSIAERSIETLRFLRGIVDGNNFQHCSPGSRVGLLTNAPTVRYRLFWNNLVTRDDVWNSVGGVLVDGEVFGTFSNPYGPAASGESWVTVEMGSAQPRKVELIWPYGDGVQLQEVQVTRGAAVQVADARPLTILAASGDSILHGFSVPDIFDTWAYRLAAAKGHRLINLGNGSAMVSAGDALCLAETGAQQVIYAIGYNNFVAQTPTATFQAALEGWIANARAELPAAKIWVPSMIYTPNTNTITPAMYRTATAAAVAAAADPDVAYVDGLSLMTNNADRLADGIHPNATGAGEIDVAWQAIID